CFKRDVKRPRLHRRDRLFWIGLRTIWKEWRSALVIVRPETVISWQRNRFKRFREWAFTRCSPQHEVHGKIHLRNGSSVAFAESAELRINGHVERKSNLVDTFCSSVGVGRGSGML